MSQTGAWSSRNSARPGAVNPTGRSATPGPATRIATPWKIPSVPSVVISALTRARATSRPFSSPPRAARPNPAATARPTGQPCRAISQPDTAPTIDIIEPTERSNTPQIISAIIPTARMPSTARLFRIARRFPVEKNDAG